MRLTDNQRQRIRNGDTRLLVEYLQHELEDVKGALLVFKPEGSSLDNVLKGKGQILTELIKLLDN